MTPVSGKPRVVVVGSGHQLAMTSYALVKKIGRDNIAVIAVDVGRDDSPEVMSTLSDMRLLISRLGIDENAFLAGCHADINLGCMLRRQDQSSGRMFANGRYGVPMNNMQFHQLYHLYHTRNPGVQFDDFSLASCLAKAGKFMGASHRVDSIFGTLDYGYSFSAKACETYFKRLALHLNVTYVKSADLDVAGNKKGIEKVVTQSGQILEADLFIDCSADGILVSQIHSAGEYTAIDRRTIPLFRQCVFVESMAEERNPLYSESIQTDHGFQSTVSHGGVTHIEQVDFLSAESSVNSGFAKGRGFTNDTGFTTASVLGRSWSGNCVALGSAFARLPNILPGTQQLFLTQLLQLLNIWFGQKDCRAIADAFSQSNAENLACLIDVLNIQLHAHPSLAAAVDLTVMNRRRIELFCGSGALPMTENAVMADQQWIALLLALGFDQQGSTLQVGAQNIARNGEPAINNTCDQLDGLRHHIQKAAASTPEYSEWINTVRERT